MFLIYLNLEIYLHPWQKPGKSDRNLGKVKKETLYISSRYCFQGAKCSGEKTLRQLMIRGIPCGGSGDTK